MRAVLRPKPGSRTSAGFFGSRLPCVFTARLAFAIDCCRLVLGVLLGPC